MGSIGATVLPAGSDVTVDVAEYFSDPDGDALTYAAATSDAGVATAAVSGSEVTVTGVSAGSADITVTARDPGGLSATQTMPITVEAVNQPPTIVGDIDNQTLAVADTFAADVAALFSDPDGDELSYSATSADTAVATASLSGSALTVVGVAAGTTTVTVAATDPGGASAEVEFAVTVTEPNRAPEAAGEIDDQTLAVADTFAADVAALFSDPDGDELSYAAMSADAAVATAALSGSALTVVGVAAGTTTVTVTATDPDGLSAEQTFAVTVEQPNRAPAIVSEIDDQTLAVADTFATDLAALFSDPDGDELSYAAMSADDAVATASVSGSMLTVAGVAKGSSAVTVTATDPGGLSAAFDFVVTVPNRAPMLADSIPAQTVAQGGEARVAVPSHFSDPDGDELSYEAATSDARVVKALVSADTVVLSGARPGGATVTVTASDPDGLSAQQTFAVTVTVPAPMIADTMPGMDMIVDSMVPLDAGAYFTGEDVTYSATTSDEAVASAAVSGSTVTTTGTGSMEDSVAISAMVKVTATNEGGSVSQEVMVRVHAAAYDTLPGITVNDDGTLATTLGGSPFTLTICVQLNNLSVGGQTTTAYWSEWQRAVGSGWVVAQDNNEAHQNRDANNPGASICPLKITEDRFPPGTYRMVGEVKFGDTRSVYRTNTIVKRPKG